VTCGRSVVFFGYSVSSTNKTDRHYITEILLKLALNTITLTSYFMKRKILNNSSNTIKMNNHLKQLNTTDQDILHWKFISWLETGTKMWQD